jgi:hypothetical protein
MRRLTISLLLLTLLFRAYVPAGFMPAPGAPFRLEICPTGMHMHMHMPQGHQPIGGHSRADDCPFGSAPGSGPVPHVVAFELAAPAVAQSPFLFESLRPGVRARAHQPRGPPALA